MISLASLLLTLCPAAAPAGTAALPQINPCPRAVVACRSLARWTFAQDAGGWTALHACTLRVTEGRLVADCTADDPYFHRPLGKLDLPAGHILLKLRIRATGSGGGQVYWGVRSSPHYAETREISYSVTADGKWHDYEVRFDTDEPLAALRLDPGQGPGRWEFESIELAREELQPLSIEEVHTAADHVDYLVQNHDPREVKFSVDGTQRTAPPQAAVAARQALRGDRLVEPVVLEVQSPGMPPVRRTLFALHPELPATWLEIRSPELTLRVSPEGTLARLWRGDVLVTEIGPLVHIDGQLPDLHVMGNTADEIRFAGDGISLSLRLAGKDVTFEIDSRRPCEGPVVRAAGPLRQGLFAGLEYLGAGEQSSSTLDIETPEHVRFAPDPLQVTIPLLAVTTDRGSVALSWDDMTLQPTYATPDFIDGTAQHRLSLRGSTIRAVLHVAPERLEETVAWAVGRHGLPALPPAPRTEPEQFALCRQALNGPIKSAEGWGHCVEAHFTRHPYASIASTVWRLTGEVPDLPTLGTGGTHVPNDAIYFVSGRARQWLQQHRQQVEGLIKNQQADGSFRYNGRYARGHFEDTASGICALPAMMILDYARWTGDARAQAAGLKALDYLARFDVPRGAQTWEVPLHTPDQLASAYAVLACVRGYEISGQQRYLAEARRWALSGVPFTYLWGRYPVMLYATTPVFGATNWTFNWIGLPVQWVGGVYAYSLTALAPYDHTLDWKHLARGILITAQQMQYPDGPDAGLLPDSFALAGQQRRPTRINPCALVSLQLALDGRVDSLAVAVAGGHRVVAPVPVTIREGRAHLQAPAGLKYQAVIGGTRIVDIVSSGSDSVELGP